MEDMQLICTLLVVALRETEALHDLYMLSYDKEKEKVTATFMDGRVKYANVALDSGTAMIRDIIAQIV